MTFEKIENADSPDWTSFWNLALRRTGALVIIVALGGWLLISCSQIPQIYDARTLDKGDMNITLGYGSHGKDDVIRRASGKDESAVAPIPLNYSAGYGLSDSLELGGTVGVYMAGGHLGLYVKFQVFELPSGFAGAVYADAGAYGMMHSITGYSVNGGVLVSYALPEDFAVDVCWTTGIGMRYYGLTDGGYMDSEIHRKESEGAYIPISMKVGKKAWFLFGTVEYPVNEEIVYQIDETDVKYVKNQTFDYLFGLGYTF